MTTTDADARHRNWWTTVPGVLTALAAIITATGGLIAVLVQAGLLGGANDRLSHGSSVLPRSTAETPSPSEPRERTSSAARGSTQVAPSATEATSELRPQQPFRGAAITLNDGSVVRLQPRFTALSIFPFGMVKQSSSIESVALKFRTLGKVECASRW